CTRSKLPFAPPPPAGGPPSTPCAPPRATWTCFVGKGPLIARPCDYLVGRNTCIPSFGRFSSAATVSARLTSLQINPLFKAHCYQSPPLRGRALSGGCAMAVDLTKPVLVVDDYNTMIRIMHNLLKQLGFEQVDDASDGSAALAKLRERDYGLVISDWSMEPMTGFARVQEMRSDRSLAEIPFIMVTAESKTENVIAAKRAGVSNYIVKPFNAQTLRPRSTRCLAKNRFPLPRPEHYHLNSWITAFGMPPAAAN